MMEKICQLIFSKENVNKHYANRYIRFIETMMRREKNDKLLYHKHHILPKSDDMFPEFKNFKNNTWNCIMLSPREHFIAHWILSKTFGNSSQKIAFYLMCNASDKKSSFEYDIARKLHIEKLIEMTKRDERNKKISNSLKGRPKSDAHIENLKGHIVTEETKEKLEYEAPEQEVAVEEEGEAISVEKTDDGVKREFEWEN